MRRRGGGEHLLVRSLPHSLLQETVRRTDAAPPPCAAPTPLPLHPLTNLPLLPSPTAKRTRALKRRRVEAAREAFDLPRSGEGAEDEERLPVLDKLEYEVRLLSPLSFST